MSKVLKIFLSMSVSGSLLALILLAGKCFLKDKISRQWQYYIWLVVILRLLLPFGPETNLMGKIYQAADDMAQAASLPQQHPLRNAQGGAQGNENAGSPAEGVETASPLQEIGALLAGHIWLVWLAAALGMLIRKVTIYQGFIRYISVGSAPVSDIGILDCLSGAAAQEGVKKPIELCVNPLVSSPLLIGFFRPCLVLPGTDISEKDLQYIFRHELTHYKRRDMFYKWLVQVTVCLHWFNPLVHLMGREIARACEFSCDEAVLVKMGCDNAQEYGKTLLDAMAAVGKSRENFGAATLSGNKKILKERLGAIMDFKKKSGAIRLLTGVLTLCVIFAAAIIGIYPVAAASGETVGKQQVSERNEPVRGEQGTHSEEDAEEDASQAERYYEAGSLPLFQIAFSRLDEGAQQEWLEKLYADGDFTFFSVAVGALDEENHLTAAFAEKAYADGEAAFFSVLTDRMDETELEAWLDRALEDGSWSFQSMLFDKLGMEETKDAWEKEWEEQQMAEYRSVGVTKDGKKYYYQGQLVNIFLDMRPNQSFYTLDINPEGEVSIQMIRNTDGEITGVSYMTEEEVIGLLNDMEDHDEDFTSMPEEDTCAIWESSSDLALDGDDAWVGHDDEWVEHGEEIVQ